VRGRSERLAAALDPRIAERVIVAAVGGDYVHDLDPAERIKMKMLLLAGLIADMYLDDAGLDEFVGQARAFR
jgi:DNA primase